MLSSKGRCNAVLVQLVSRHPQLYLAASTLVGFKGIIRKLLKVSVQKAVQSKSQ